MTAAQQQQAAKNFAAYWKGKGYEKGESQPFWLSLLRDVYGVEHPEQFIQFEEQVHLDHTSFIDGTIPATHVLIEQKGMGKDLNKPIKQSDGALLTPFEQAKRYILELPVSQHPRWVVTCNFSTFYVYDMERPHGEPEIIELANLEKEYYRLQFLVDAGNEHLKREMEVSIAAGEIVGLLYDAFYKQYANPESEHSLKSLNKLCVRLVFCLYAEDAGIFGHHGMFHDYLKGFDTRGLRKGLVDLFRVLDTKPQDRDPYLQDDNPELAAFPYVNGGLFSDENIEIPPFTDEIRNLLLNKASEDFNWSEISPTIFGAVFESTLNPETRRSGGMHYTSIENIHKVIDPLFLDELKGELDEICANPVERTRTAKLRVFQRKLASLTFLDPACGSGNFLTETYLSLRRLENKVLVELSHGQVTMYSASESPIQVSISQFYGIEINDFAVTVAKTALWIAESQMMKETEKILLVPLEFLPLKTNAYIVEGNALRVDWESVVSKGNLHYIMGNPPWQSNITGKTKEYLKKANRVIGDKQIAQAFSIKCSELCKQNGIICLLMPSKGLLFNRSDKSRAYRANLFSDNNVLAIINLSVYRKFLFDHASGPAAAIIYTPKKEDINQPIVYCTPKPIYTIEDIRKFSIDPTDICRIPRDIIDDDRIWKIAMWGAPRDLELIGKMQSTFAPMASFIEENHMTTAEGFKRGNRKHQCCDFKGLPMVEAKSFKPYYVSSDELPRVDFDDFECIVKNAREIFVAPHLIIKQSHKNGTFLSEVLDYDAVFNHSLLGIHGNINKLKYLSVVIGSKVFSYYHILTNRKWLVERDELEAGDIWQTPIPSPNEAEINEACEIFDELVISPTKNGKAEQFVRHMYRLREYESYQIDDVIDYVYDYFKNKQRSVSFERPNPNAYKLYYDSLSEVLTNTFGASTGLTGDLYFGDAPLSVLVLNIGQQNDRGLNFAKSDDRLNEILMSLDGAVVDNQKMIFIRRNLRIYQPNRIFIIKPSQRKYWTYSAACRDADEIFEDISRAWR